MARSVDRSTRDHLRIERALNGMQALAAYAFLSRLLKEQQPDYVPPPDLMAVCRRIGELVHERRSA